MPTQAEKQLRRDFQVTFGSEEGQRVLDYLCNEFHVLRSTHFGPPTDTHETSFREGQRNVVLSILQLLRKSISVEELQQQQERADLETANAARFDQSFA